MRSLCLDYANPAYSTLQSSTFPTTEPRSTIVCKGVSTQVQQRGLYPSDFT